MRNRISFILFTLLTLTLFSCSSAAKVTGTINAVNVDIPKSITVDFVLYNSVSSVTKKISTKVQPNGNFKVRIKANEMYLVHVSVPSNHYSLSDDWLLSEPIQLKSGQNILLEDLYLSSRFSVTSDHGMSRISSIEEMSFSWDPVELADFYAVHFSESIGNGDLVFLHITKDPEFSGSSKAPLISFDTKMTPIEFSQNVPFFRIKEKVESGQFQFRVVAVKKTSKGFESIIAESEKYTIYID